MEIPDFPKGETKCCFSGWKRESHFFLRKQLASGFLKGEGSLCFPYRKRRVSGFPEEKRISGFLEGELGFCFLLMDMSGFPEREPLPGFPMGKELLFPVENFRFSRRRSWFLFFPQERHFLLFLREKGISVFPKGTASFYFT